jgi:hypothetical protein
VHPKINDVSLKITPIFFVMANRTSNSQSSEEIQIELFQTLKIMEIRDRNLGGCEGTQFANNDQRKRVSSLTNDNAILLFY